MEQEKLQPVPLSGLEAQEGILYKLAESLSKSGHLHPDNAFSTVKITADIRLVLSDFGRDTKDNHQVEFEAKSKVEGGPERTVDLHLEVEPMPPNQFRVETDQSVPVKTTEDGKTVVKHVKYAARKVK